MTAYTAALTDSAPAVDALTRRVALARPQLDNVGGQDAILNPLLNPEAVAGGGAGWGWFLGGFDSGGSSALGVADGPAGGPATSFDVTKTLSSNTTGLFHALPAGDSASGVVPAATMAARGYLRINGGHTVRCGGWIKAIAGTSGAQMGLLVYWRDEQGAWIGSTTIASLGVPSGGWQWLSGSAVAPANAAWTMFWAQVPLLAGSIEVRATGFVQYVNGPSTIAFFDGNSPGAAWIGTANASGSLLSAITRQTSTQRAIADSAETAPVQNYPAIVAPATGYGSWTNSIPGVTAVGSVDAADQFNAQNSWDVTFSGLGNNMAGLENDLNGATNTIAVTPGQMVIVTVAVKVSAAWNFVQTQIRFLGGSGGGTWLANLSSTNVLRDDAWHVYTLRCDVPTAATFAGITVVANTPASGAAASAYMRIVPLTLQVVGSIVRQAAVKRAIADAAPAADALTRLATIKRALADAAGGQDALLRATATARTLPEALSSADTLTRALTQARTLPQPLNGSQALQRSLTAIRALPENHPLAEQLSRSAGRSRQIADSAPALDHLTAAYWKQLTVEGRATILPSLLARLNIDPSLAAALTIDPSLLARLTADPSLAAALTVGPALEAALTIE